jgi:hypothetical protein
LIRRVRVGIWLAVLVIGWWCGLSVPPVVYCFGVRKLRDGGERETQPAKRERGFALSPSGNFPFSLYYKGILDSGKWFKCMLGIIDSARLL